MRVYSALVFYFCLNAAAFTINMAGILPASQQFYASNPNVWSSTFDFTTLIALGIGGVGAGLIGLLTRQYVYATGAIIIWTLGVMIEKLSWFFIGIPKVIDALLPSDGSLSWFGWIITGFVSFLFFIFVLEIALQRQIT